MESKIQFVIIGITVLLCMLLQTPTRMCVVLGGCILCLVLVSILFRRRRERDVAELISYLMRVQDRLELPDLAHMQEGQFGILQSEIYKLIVILQEQYSSENKEKRYLVDMLSDISHQIKTPMAAITIMSDLLKSPGLSDEKRLEYVAKIDQQLHRIHWLVRNLLTISQLEADMLELKADRVRVEEMIEEVLQPVSLLADVKDVELIVQVPSDIWLVCDKQWTTEAISNIVKNCIEHTKENGTVAILVTQNNFSTNIVIRDNGDGISKEHLPYIFKRFYKAPGSSNSNVGIGLSMSKQIIMRQNGNIDVTSEVGVGTEFVIKMYHR